MFSKVLVPLDRSALSEQAVGQAAAIARASHAEVDLVSVHEPFAFNGYTDAPWNSAEWTAEHTYLQAIADELRLGAMLPVTYAVMRGAPAEMIATRAHNVGADLIVMTSHGRTGLSRTWLGSVADAVVRHSSIPVLMLRPAETESDRLHSRHTFKHVLVPLDGSPLAADVLEAAVGLAKGTNARMTVLQVVQPVPLLVAYDAQLPYVYPPVIEDDTATQGLVASATYDLNEVAERLREEQSIDVAARVEVGAHVARTIVDYARAHEVDAIAMSTHGRGASRFLVGSVADKVLRSSGLPVLMRHPAAVREPSWSLKASEVIEQLPALAG